MKTVPWILRFLLALCSWLERSSDVSLPLENEKQDKEETVKTAVFVFDVTAPGDEARLYGFLPSGWQPAPKIWGIMEYCGDPVP